MQCPRCQQENPPKAKFCEECAAPLARTCASCGTQLSPTAKFCPECAHPVVAGPAEPRFASPQSYTPKHLAQKILTSKSALEGERKQVTVLFCDIVGSTALAERLGAEAMHGLLDEFFELALAEIHRYEGTINQFLGDGFMALFGAPVAHEDHAQRGVLAALAIRRELRDRHAHLGAGEIIVRMGLNTGLVVVGSIGDNLRMDYTAVGDTTNLAARLQQRAAPGTILVSDATSRLVRSFVKLDAVGDVDIRGKSRPVAAYQIVGLGRRRSPLEGLEDRAHSRFVGRQRELATLHDLLGHVEQRRGQVVGIVGEPGMGKSRLLYEFRQSLAGGKVTYLEGRCLSYGNTIPYLPVLDIVRVNCGINDTDTPESIGDKVRFSLRELAMDADEVAPYLFHLLGIKEGTERLAVLTAQAIKERTFETLQQMSLRGSRQQPVIFGVEDLHWVDRTSEEYLAFLVERLAGAAILILCTYRPGYRPSWIDKSYATQIGIRALSSSDSLVVVQSVLEDQSVRDDVAQGILAKAEGNPFFLEELCRGVLDHPDLRHGPLVPETVQDVLMARIDRLPDDTKRLLQMAAVLGREVPLALLMALWQGGGLEAHLAELRRQEFLFEGTGGENPVYVFKHALTREVGYEGLLIAQREVLHAAAGRALEMLYADRLEQVYDRLAYHYAESTEATKAVEYLIRVAEKAGRSYAHAEALAALEKAVPHVKRLSDEQGARRFFQVLNRRGESLYYLGRFRDIVSLFPPYEERLVQLSDPQLASDYYFWLASAYTFLGDRERAARNAERALEEATRGGEAVAIGRAHVALTVEGYFSGQLAQAIQHGRLAVAVLEGTAEQALLGAAYYYLAGAYIFASELDLTLESAARADEIGQTIGDRRIQTNAAVTSAFAHIYKGNCDEGIEAAQRALECSPDQFETALALGAMGAAWLERGDVEQALEVLTDAVAQATRFRSRQIQAHWKVSLGEAYLLSEQREEARTVAREALEISREVRYPLGIASAQSLLGRIARASGALAEAQDDLNQALQTLTSIRSRYWMARAHVELASLAGAQGNREAATSNLLAARSLFVALRVPNWVKRSEHLAEELGVGLPDDPTGP